jgi:anaphase-promoting complex subunit 10
LALPFSLSLSLQVALFVGVILTAKWQTSRSDGTQPHNLTVYFVKKVGIREIRFYVDYDQDESYTPTRIIFRSGTSENNLIKFAAMDLANPKGWQKVPLDGVGGGPDGNTLFCWVLQMSITENHQNGKDTHLRGIKIFALDTETAVANGGTDRGALGEWVVGDVQTPVSSTRRRLRGSLRRLEVDPETPIRRRGHDHEEGSVGPGRRQHREILGVADITLSAEFIREPELR